MHKIFRKFNISYPLIRTRTCGYQGVRNVNFSEKFFLRTKWVKSVHIWSYSGPYSVQKRENTDQKNSEYWHFLCSALVKKNYKPVRVFPKAVFVTYLLVNIYLFKVNSSNIRKKVWYYSRLTIKTPEQRHWRCSGVFIANFEHISHLFLVLLFFNFKHVRWELLLAKILLVWSVNYSNSVKLTLNCWAVGKKNKRRKRKKNNKETLTQVFSRNLDLQLYFKENSDTDVFL